MPRRLGLGTLSARVIGLSALMTLAIISAAFTLTYIAATRILEQETAEVVEAELRGIVDSSDGGRNLPALITTVRDRAVGESEAIYLLTDREGRRSSAIFRTGRRMFAPMANGQACAAFARRMAGTSRSARLPMWRRSVRGFWWGATCAPSGTSRPR
jgi:hypothetical protein